MAARRQQPAGRLRVNAAHRPSCCTPSCRWWPSSGARYPQIELELDTDELNIDLLERRTDIAIRIGHAARFDAACAAARHAAACACWRARPTSPPHGRARRRGEPGAAHACSASRSRSRSTAGRCAATHGDEWPITPALAASSGETLRQLALEGVGHRLPGRLHDRSRPRARRPGAGAGRATRVDVRQPINAVYYRNTQLSARITCFLDFLAESLGSRWA